MMRLAKGWIRHRVPVMMVCLVLGALSVLGIGMTRVSYDVLSDLPQDMEAVRGQTILREAFGRGDSALLMTQGLTSAAQLELETQIGQIEGVQSVLGYATFTQNLLPSAMLPDSVREKLRIEQGDARLSVVFFTDSASSEETMRAVEAIRHRAGTACLLSGLGAVVTDMKHLAHEEEGVCCLIAFGLVLLALLLVTDAYLLPIVFLLCAGCGLLWNLGTNWIFGEIGELTLILSVILQLGISIRFSVSLLSAYRDKKRIIHDRTEAMAAAVTDTLPDLTASALTTVAGFAALCLMSLPLGLSFGLVMLKGVLLGFLSSLLLFPCLMRSLDGAIEKTRHRPLMIPATELSRFVLRHHRFLCVLLAVLAVPVVYGALQTRLSYDPSSFLPSDAPANLARQTIEETFGVSDGLLLEVRADLSQHDLHALSAELRETENVTSSLSLDTLLGTGMPADFLPENLTSAFRSGDTQLILLGSSLQSGTEAMNRQIEAIQTTVIAYDEEGVVTGTAAYIRDLMTCMRRDLPLVLGVTAGLVFLVLAVRLSSFSLPLVVLLILGVAAAAPLAVTAYLNRMLPFLVPLLVLSILLGSSADAGVQLSARYVGMRRRGTARRESVSEAIRGCAAPVWAGSLCLVAANLGVAFFASSGVVSALCLLIALGAGAACLLTLFFLPALLIFLDPILIRSSLGMKEARRTSAAYVEDL